MFNKSQNTHLLLMIRPETSASRANSMIRIILAAKAGLLGDLGPISGTTGGLTKLCGFLHGASRKSEHTFPLRCSSAAIWDDECIASFGENINHRLKDLLYLGNDKTCLDRF